MCSCKKNDHFWSHFGIEGATNSFANKSKQYIVILIYINMKNVILTFDQLTDNLCPGFLVNNIFKIRIVRTHIVAHCVYM